MSHCRDWTFELVERARSGMPASAELMAHMESCPSCSTRWETECELSRRFRHIREALPAANPLPGRDRILAEFEWQQRRARWNRRLAWTLAPAGVFAVALALLAPWHGPATHGFPVPAETCAAEWNRAIEELAELDSEESTEFLSVPYTPPLATGEYTHVERMELPRAALVRMGFAVETSSENAVTADVVVGEDGLPRAVRVPERLDMQY